MVCPSGGISKILELRCLLLVFTLYKAFLKSKRRSGTSFPAFFSVYSFKKNIFHVIFY